MDAIRRFRRESYQRNKAAVAARNKAWKRANAEKVRATGLARSQQADVKERRRERRRESYQGNKAAEAARNKAWKRANAEKVRATGRAYRSRPEVKEQERKAARSWRAANLERSRARDRAQRARHRAHRLAYRAAWRAANRDRLIQQAKAWRALNLERARATARLVSQRRRARERAALIVPFTRAQLGARLAYWGNRCYICGAPWQSIDHVKPLSKGGAHCLANFRPLCEVHNTRKQAQWYGVAWIRRMTGAGEVLAAVA
jgi:5-methylcytosine-specific restriction endonuclease McrA